MTKNASFRGRSLLRLALNGYTQIQIEKILFPIMNFRFSPSARLAEESHTNPNSHSEGIARIISCKPCQRYFAFAQYDGMTWIVLWIASKSKIFRNDVFNLQILQIDYSHLMKQWKNSCCLSVSEFTSLGLNLVTVFSRRCFSFLSNVLSFFFAIKKKEYLVRGLGLHKPQL